MSTCIAVFFQRVAAANACNIDGIVLALQYSNDGFNSIEVPVTYNHLCCDH